MIDSDTGEPLEKILVYLVVGRKMHARRVTGADGRYDFGYVEAQKYVLTAGRHYKNYVQVVEDLDLTEDRDIELRIRKHQGFTVRVEMPADTPMPRVITIAHRKEGRKEGQLLKLPIDESGAGHTMKIFPGTYDMTFSVPGFRPIPLRIEHGFVQAEPLLLRFDHAD